jgi:cell division protein FtsN
MRPDLEDYADIEEPAVGRSRAMSWMVLTVAVGGFAALAYYAYNSGTRPAADGDMLIVEADGSAIKEIPEDAEGEQFANKDKTIYDVISPGEGEAGVEKLLPEPERPVVAANAEDADAPTTFVAGADAKQEDPLDMPAPPTAVKEVPVAETAKPVEKPVAATAAPVEKSYAAPEMINEKPVAASAPAPQVKPAEKAVEKPKAAEKPATAKSGSYMVQLGAFKSETEAQSAWKKISGKYASILSGSPSIVKADVNGSTFYRLRAGGFSSSDAAKAACAAMSGQACFPVK